MSGCFMVDGLFNLLLLLWGVDNFFAFGVWADATTFPLTLVPRPVFFSCHTTCSYVGDEEIVLFRFPFISLVWKGGWRYCRGEVEGEGEVVI